MRILDCTLRDGGYYTNWDFEIGLVKEYLTTVNDLPIDYIEIGYRQPAKTEYMGEYAYLPMQTIRQCRKYAPNKELAVMLNLKDVDETSVVALLEPLKGIIPMIRFATAPKDVEKVSKIAANVQKLGFKVSVNFMYMSTWLDNEMFWQKLPLLNGNIDLLCMVDSYGAVYPQEVPQIVANPVIDNGIVYLAGNANLCGAYELKTGQTKWTIPVGSTVTPIVSGNTLFVLSNQNKLIAVDKRTGKLFWEKEMPNESKSTERNLLLINSELVLQNGDRWIFVNPLNGEIIRTQKQKTATLPIADNLHLLILDSKLNATRY